MTEREKHMCINCRFYLKGAHYDCRENVDELVKDKDRPNFCDWFSLDENACAKNEQAKKESSAKAQELFDKFFNI